MKSILSATCILLFVSCTTHAEQSPESELKQTVATINQMLEAKRYDGAVKTLFGLTNSDEISKAAQHLQRPRCLEFYNILFRKLDSQKPTIQHNIFAYYKIDQIDLSYDSHENMRVMFYRIEGNWRFNDPSFDKKLGRRLIDDLKKESEPVN